MTNFYIYLSESFSYSLLNYSLQMFKLFCFVIYLGTLMHQLPHSKAIGLQRQQILLSVQVHGLHHCPWRGTSAVLGFRSRCRPVSPPSLFFSFFLSLY